MLASRAPTLITLPTSIIARTSRYNAMIFTGVWGTVTPLVIVTIFIIFIVKNLPMRWRHRLGLIASVGPTATSSLSLLGRLIIGH